MKRTHNVPEKSKDSFHTLPDFTHISLYLERTLFSRERCTLLLVRNISGKVPGGAVLVPRVPVSSGELGEALSWDRVVQLDSSSLGARFWIRWSAQSVLAPVLGWSFLVSGLDDTVATWPSSGLDWGLFGFCSSESPFPMTTGAWPGPGWAFSSPTPWQGPRFCPSSLVEVSRSA